MTTNLEYQKFSLGGGHFLFNRPGHDLDSLTIQQYALKKVQELQKTEGNEDEIEVYEKMVMRSLFGNINASRNSA